MIQLIALNASKVHASTAALRHALSVMDIGAAVAGMVIKSEMTGPNVAAVRRRLPLDVICLHPA